MSRLTEKIDIDGMEIKVAKERPLSDQGLGKIIHKLYYLENIEEELDCPLDVIVRALKIIKKKNVNCFKLRFCKNLEDYNLYLEGFVNPKTKKISSESYLTQEEFDLLKEVLKDVR